jgi:predicted amidohydrolase YtcJ
MKHCLLIAFLLAATTSNAQADYILYNGKVFTSDRARLWSEAIAIRGERILYVGTNAQVLKLKNKATNLINLNGRLVVPGFNDAHAHVGPVYPARRFDLGGGNPFELTPWVKIKDSIAKIVKEIPAGTFIITAISPDLLEDVTVRKKTLDSVAPNNPVMLSAWTGHGKIMNSAALKFFGIDEHSEFLGGRIDRDMNQQCTGVLEEYANYRMAPILADKLKSSKIIEDLKAYYIRTAALDITTTQNMCSQIFTKQTIDIYTTQKFPCRVRLMTFSLTDDKQLLLQEWNNYFHALNDLNYVSGVKLVLDGTPVERLACLKQPYSDRENAYGRINFDELQLKQYFRYCLEHKQQVIIHACGDSTIATVIRTMQAMYPDSFWKNKRVRIEHGDFAGTNAEEINTLKQLGIIIVENPTHLTLPDLFAKRLGDVRLAYYQPMRSLLDNDIHFAIGSDGPFNPFLNIMFATMHLNNPKEAITREEAVIAYTLGSAYAEFEENEKGTLAKGKLADLAVLSQDIFTVSVDKLPSTESVVTFIGGKIVYKKNDFQSRSSSRSGRGQAPAVHNARHN